jgi:UTP--glucose-1-phosphate uridylyltransferase
MEEMRRRFAGKAWGLEVSDRLEDIGRRLTLIPQASQEGYGHAVYCAREWVGGEPFLLLLGDHVYLSHTDTSPMRQVVDVAERYGEPVFAVQRTPEERLYLYGTVAGAPVPEDPGVWRIERLREKPEVEYARENFRLPGLPPDEYLCFFGMHALTPDIFDCLQEMIAGNHRERGEFQFTSAQELLIARTPALAFEVRGESFDMGNPLGLLETQIALGLRGVYRDEVRAFLKAWEGREEPICP